MRRDLFTGDLLKKIKEVYLSPGEEAVKAAPIARQLSKYPQS
jgi:hypothetical protein